VSQRKKSLGAPLVLTARDAQISACRKTGGVIYPPKVGPDSHRQKLWRANARRVGPFYSDEGKRLPLGNRLRVVRAPRPAREVPLFTGDVQLPFWAFDAKLCESLDLTDGDADICRIATGDDPPPAERPNDPLTAWVALAYHGGIEWGGPVLRRELDREQRLEIAKQVLNEDEWLVVETIAVPRRYRHEPAKRLEEMIRTAPDYRDRMWASCWLILVGWTTSPQCSFSDVSNEFPLGELEHLILDCYAHSRGVETRRDSIGWRRICGDYETNLVLHRLAICETHYRLNGPPPHEQMRDTVPGGDGWKRVVRLVPEYSR
jgi:hypothetical protein